MKRHLVIWGLGFLLLAGWQLHCTPEQVRDEPDATSPQEAVLENTPTERKAEPALEPAPEAKQEPVPEQALETTPEPPAPSAPRALLLDHQMGALAHWIEVVDALQMAGFVVEYRRYYPHLTEADVLAPANGQPRYQLVMMAAANVPGQPGSQMRHDEIQTAARFVVSGGILLLAPISSKQDTGAGENEFVLFNRLLQFAAAPIRIEKTTILGDAWVSPGGGQPAPPHIPSVQGYPSTLEGLLGFPYLKTQSGHATEVPGTLAGGSIPTLLIGEGKVEVLLRTHKDGYLWRNQAGDPNNRIELLERERAVAAVAQARDGYICVVGKGILTSLGALSGASSDKPAMDLKALGHNRSFLQKMFAHLLALQTKKLALQPNASDKDALIRVTAANLTPISGTGPIYTVGSGVSMLPVPAKPPADDLLEPVPLGDATPPTRPAWMSAGGARIAYGDMTKTRPAMKDAFAEIKTYGVDALLSNVNMERLHDPKSAEGIKTMVAEVATMAKDAGVHWILSGFFHTYFIEKSGTYPGMVGAQGQDLSSSQNFKAPAHIHEAYWANEIIPVYEEVGKLAKDNSGILGMSFDLELYAGPLWHSDGYAFSDSTTLAFLAKVDAAFSTQHGDTLKAQKPHERFAYLMDKGLLKVYYETLEAIAASLGERCRKAAHAHAPALQLMMYVPVFPSSWFYRGFLRGLGTSTQPVVVMSFEPWGKRAQTVFHAQQVYLWHIGGAQASHWRPQEFASVLAALAKGNEGYWYLSFNDFSKTNATPPALHGKGEQYWSAVQAAHKEMVP